MSIATAISRIISLRDRLREKINALGIDNDDQLDLDGCVAAVEFIGGTQDITDASVQYDVAAKQYARVRDSNLIPANIVRGVTILGVAGTASSGGHTAQLTTGNLLYGGQNVPSALVPPSGYDGFDRVLVELTDANPMLVPSNIKNGATIMGVTGNYETTTEAKAPTLAELKAQGITSHDVTITPSQSHFHLSQVTIPRIGCKIDDNIASKNIRAGVQILGVTGTYSPLSYDVVQDVQVDTSGSVTEIFVSGIDVVPSMVSIMATVGNLTNGKIISVHKNYTTGSYDVNYISNGAIVRSNLSSSTIRFSITEYQGNEGLVVEITHPYASFSDTNYAVMMVF